MLKLAALLLTLPALYLSLSIKYHDCNGQQYSTISSVSIRNVGQQPLHIDIHDHLSYVFFYNHTYEGTINFTPMEDFDTMNLTNVASGIIREVNIPFEMDADPCNDGGVKCPIHAGDHLVYKANITVPINTTEVQIKLLAKWQLYDPVQDKDVLCFVFPAITRPLIPGPPVGRALA